MTVTETTVHKLNGIPYYLWQQNADLVWERAAVDDASNTLQGVVSDQDAFEFRYKATLPQISDDAGCWLPLAQSDSFQAVTVKSINVPGKKQILTDSAHGNRVIFLELTPENSGQVIEVVYDVVRKEKSAYAGDPKEAQRYLQPERMVPSDATIQASAEQAVEGRQSDLMKARALYDHVMEQMQYKKFGEGWGQGNAVFACNSLYGNCTDYHALFIGLARSVDISEADKFSALSMYFFGHHPANRFEFTQGRDLILDPGPASGPINFLAYPLLEVNGQPQKVPTLFLFNRTSNGQGS